MMQRYSTTWPTKLAHESSRSYSAIGSSLDQRLCSGSRGLHTIKGNAVGNNNETEPLLNGSTQQHNSQSIPPGSEPERLAESAQNRENEERVEPTPFKRGFIIPSIVRLVGSPKTLVVLAASVCNAVFMKLAYHDPGLWGRNMLSPVVHAVLPCSHHWTSYR
ncbi:hypothetical protein VTN02DRAFT_104 [Thermoascus thermophilus]